MAEAVFLDAAETTLSSIRTWFNASWKLQDVPYSSPIVSGLDPLLLEGTTTVGNCRVSCATARIVQLTGFSDATISGDNTTVAFRTCEVRELLITLPVTLDLAARVLYYGMVSGVASTATVATTAAGAGALLLTVPFFSNGTTHTVRFDLLKAAFNCSVVVNPPEVDDALQAYVSAAVAKESSVAMDALRTSFGSVSLETAIRQAIRLGSVTFTSALPTVAKQLTGPSCTLTAPCDPCDKCCLCVSRQICTDQCMDCPCMQCETQARGHHLLFIGIVLIFCIAIVVKTKRHGPR